MRYLLAAIVSGALLLGSGDVALAQHRGSHGGFHGNSHWGNSGWNNHSAWNHSNWNYGRYWYPGFYGGVYRSWYYPQVYNYNYVVPSTIVPSVVTEQPLLIQVTSDPNAPYVALTPEQDATAVMYPGYDLYYANGHYYHVRHNPS